ncbi:MAG: class II aldolase/adducin family protein [Planctomycetota bacterium]
MSEIERLKTDIVTIARLCYQHRYIVGIDGNVSTRMDDGTILITASGICKGFMDETQIVHLDAEGRPVGGGNARASSELQMHLLVYRRRPDVKAVVHAHPAHAVAFSIAGVSLAQCVIPEIVTTIGSIPTTPYATPGTEELPQSIADAIAKSDALILERHGTLTVGDDLLDAFRKLEQVEHTARITFIARQLGQVKTLGPSEIERLLEVRRKLGIQGMNTLVCGNCAAKDIFTVKDQVATRAPGFTARRRPGALSSRRRLGL